MKEHRSCKFFGYRALCLYGEHELMRQFLSDAKVPQSSVPITIDFSKGEEVDKMLCASCEKYESKKDA